MKWNFAYPVSFLLLWTLPAQAESAALVPPGPPLFFTAEPEDAIVSRGETLALYCNVTTTSDEEANVTWFKEGEANLAPRRGSILILTHDANDKKTGKREIDGYYYCVAQTKILAIRSRSALVKLEHYERTTTTGGKSFHLNDIVSATTSGNFKNLYWKIECNSIEFTCPSQHRSLCPFFYEELVTGRLMRQSVLRIDYNGLQGQGGPACQKNDPIKLYILNAPAGKLHIKEFNYNADALLPRLDLQPQSLSKQRGDNVTLTCQGRNLGNQYIWYKDHKPLSESPRVTMNNGTLFIPDVKMQDAGTYACQSSLGNIKRTAKATLIVYDLPKVSFDKLHCNVSGSNISEVLLIRNDVILKRMPVNHSSVHQLVKLSTANGLGVMYQCLANSKYGSVQKSIYLANKTPKPTTPKPVTRYQSKTFSEDVTISSGTAPSTVTSVKATSIRSTSPSLGQANATTHSLSSTMGSVKAKSAGISTETALGQASSATTQPTPTTAAKTTAPTSTSGTTASPSVVSTTTAKATASSTGSTTATGDSTGDTSVQSTVVNKDSPGNGSNTTAAAATTSTGATTTSLTESITSDNTPMQTATTISDATSPIVTATAGATEQSAAINTDKVTTDAEATAPTTSTGSITASLAVSTTGGSGSSSGTGDDTSVQSTVITVPATDGATERSAATNTDKVATDAGSTVTNAMNRRSLTGIITIGAASGGIVLVLLTIIIVVIACKRKRGHFPISTETAKRAHCQLTSNPSYIRTNSAQLESAYATIPEDTAESGKIAPQMPGPESVVYATVDSCLPKDDGIPKSAQNQDGLEKPKSSHTSDYADVEKCCEGCPGCAAISHGEQRDSAIAHVSINGDEYAVCQKETTSQKHSTESLSRESKVKHMTVGEDEYTLCGKKSENQSNVPDHFTTNGGDMYAVSMKSKETDSSSTKEKKVKRK
ncbi:mucin-22-like isoform X2 [Oscarella lobularis]